MKYLKTYEKFLLENISKGAEIQYNQEMSDIEKHNQEIKDKKLEEESEEEEENDEDKKENNSSITHSSDV